MKKQLILSFAAFLLSTVTFAQSRFDNWPEMQKYQTLLAKMYQPAVDGDLEPVKMGSHELLANCKLINLSHYPQQFEKDEVHAAMKIVEKETDKLNAFVVMKEQKVSIMKQLHAVQKAYKNVEALCKTISAEPATAQQTE